MVQERLIEINRHYGYTFGRISIRNQKHLWGSCSKTGNLNFNYRILFLPPALRDYIIAHELCHRKEMNHSARFWSLVRRAIPEPHTLRREFRRQGYTLG